jgi:HSP20 family protein
LAWDEEFDRWFRRLGQMPFFKNSDDIEKMFDRMFREMLEGMPKELVRERRLPDGGTVREMGPFVYGYSMSMGPDGKPVIREFGNVKPSQKLTPFGRRRPTLQYREEREPLVDVMDEDERVKVLTEVPGVEKSDINLSCTEELLTISVDTERRKYYKEIELPAAVDPQSATATYKHGVLEVNLRKIEKRKPHGKSIRIE